MIYWIVLIVFVLTLVIFFGWRWTSRIWSLPCPTLLAWLLESPLLQWVGGTKATLNRMDLQPGQRILEIGPGPGRLLIPAADRVSPGGEAVGIDIQPGMIDRLKKRADEAGITNLTAIHGDATQPHVEEGRFDLVFLVTALGEIPDRTAALRESHKALRPGGILSITEMFGDPHYQSRSKVKRLAEKTGFELQAFHGNWRLFTANFVKP